MQILVFLFCSRDLQESVSNLLADISNVKKKHDLHPKYNTAIPIHYASPTADKLSSITRLSPTHKYTTEKWVSTGYGKPSPQIQVSSIHQASKVPNDVTSLSSEIHGIQTFIENEVEIDNISILVNNLSENSVTALSLKSKMSTLSETDFSLWSATYDGVEFQKNIEHLDAEINRIQSSMKRPDGTG